MTLLPRVFTIIQRVTGAPAIVCMMLALAAMLATGLPLSSAALAQSGNAFTIADYPVQARDKNAVAAKKAAIADGQTAALNSLFKRLVPVTAYGRLKQLKDVDAAQYLEGIAVRSEQNSAVEYLATLDFRFSADAVRGLLRQRGVPFIDEQAPLVTVVPVAVGPEGELLDNVGIWGEVWTVLDLKNALSPVNVASRKASVTGSVLKALAAGDESQGFGVVSRDYGSSRVVVASAEVDTAARRLKVRVDGRDAVGPINWSRSYRIYDGDAAYAMELAAVVTLGVLEGRWKATKARQSGGVSALSQPMMPVRVEVLFENARDWYALQRQIAETSNVEAFQVVAVSARRADVALDYPGGGPALANVLARQGLSMVIAGDRWIVKQLF